MLVDVIIGDYGAEEECFDNVVTARDNIFT
jgi:hypothetical protein